MQKPQPFVVPAGVTFQITDEGVVIENEGDIVLHTNFGRALTRIVSTGGSIVVHAPVRGGTLHAAGDIAVHGDAQADSVQAGGGVAVHGNAQVASLAAGGSVAVGGDLSSGMGEAGGDVGVGGAATASAVRAGGTVDLAGAAKVDTVHGSVIRFRGASVAARGVQGAHAVHIGAAKLQVDAIIAPEVHLDPGTSGRATIVESHNDLGPNALKGGFRLADYAEMFGDPASFLQERGVAPLGESVAPPPPVAAPVAAAPVVAAPVAAAAPDPEPAPVAPPPPPLAAAEPTYSVETIPAVEATEEVEVSPEPLDAEEEAPPVVQEPVGDPATATGDTVVPDDAPPPVPEHPLHKQLVDAVTRITESYADAELPPAVNHLMSLIETRSYDQVRSEITAIWSDLLKYHQKKGLRIQHQVTTTFNTINSLVKKM